MLELPATATPSPAPGIAGVAPAFDSGGAGRDTRPADHDRLARAARLYGPRPWSRPHPPPRPPEPPSPNESLVHRAERLRIPEWILRQPDGPRMLDRMVDMAITLDDALARPVGMFQRGDMRRVSILWTLGVEFDFATRSIRAGVYRDLNRFVPLEGSCELLRPFADPHWLGPLVDRALHRDDATQGDLFLSQEDADARKLWVQRALFRLLRDDPRFRRMRRETLPAALAFDPSLTRIALAARAGESRGLGSAHLALVWRHEAAYRQLERENPRLLPMLTACLRGGMVAGGRDPVGAMRDFLEFLGVGAAAWRYLCRHGARILQLPWQLLRDSKRLEAAVDYLRTLQAAGLPPPPPPSFVRAWIAGSPAARHARWGRDGWKKLTPPVLHVALRRADRLRHGPLLGPFAAQAAEVLEWAARDGLVPDKLQRRAGWPWLVARYDDTTEVARLLATLGDHDWKSAVPAFDAGALRVEPLTSRRELLEEGRAMRNCLGDYADHCLDGDVRVFSIRHAASDRRVADIGIRRTRGGWEMIEVRGFANALVRPWLEALGDEVAQRYSEALGGRDD